MKGKEENLIRKYSWNNISYYEYSKDDKQKIKKTLEAFCEHCGKPIEQHSKATQLCPDRFAHFKKTY